MKRTAQLLLVASLVIAAFTLPASAGSFGVQYADVTDEPLQNGGQPLAVSELPADAGTNCECFTINSTDPGPSTDVGTECECFTINSTDPS